MSIKAAQMFKRLTKLKTTKYESSALLALCAGIPQVDYPHRTSKNIANMYDLKITHVESLDIWCVVSRTGLITTWIEILDIFVTLSYLYCKMEPPIKSGWEILSYIDVYKPNVYV